jgi:5'-nucleotidase
MNRSRHITDLSKARILVTNDDGIHAPGLEVLEKIARSLSDDVWVVAPEVEQSGAGHSLSLHSPIRFSKWNDKRYSVRGTPTDSVIYGVIGLLDNKVDLVLSGVNRGMNVAEDITHSGTVAAAMEGTLCGVPSIALSQAFAMWDLDVKVRWDLPEKYAADVIRNIMRAGIPPGILMNVNFPDCPAAKCKGVKMAYTGRRHTAKQLDAKEDKKGRPYYWIHWGDEALSELQPGSDLAALQEGYITVTPINLDLTDYKVLEQMREHLES